MPRWEFLVALAGAAVMFWNHAKSFVAWLRSWVIITKKTDYRLGAVLLSYLDATTKRTRAHDGAYGSATTFVRPLERLSRVVYQMLSASRQTFWRHRRPIWFTSEATNRNESTSPKSDYMMSFSYLRGSLDWEKLLLEAVDWEDEKKTGSDRPGTRFSVRYHFGTSGLSDGMLREAKTFSRGASEAPSLDGVSWNGIGSGTRLLRWTFEDVQGFSLVSSMDHLSLRPELEKVVEELKFWHQSQDWYQKHGVPWRRGVLFHGGPGTGKTSLARALAEQLDLPVHVFDLAGMSNHDFKHAWREMMTTSPCMALLEDLDAVFKGRDNKNQKDAFGGGGLTFDTLLNCLDGVERVDGLLVVVTTNNLDGLDEALVRRPGRIDRVVKFEPLDQAGRVKMAMRILEDAKTAEHMAHAYHQDTAAQFQERCFQHALQRRFEEHANVVPTAKATQDAD